MTMYLPECDGTNILGITVTTTNGETVWRAQVADPAARIVELPTDAREAEGVIPPTGAWIIEVETTEVYYVALWSLGLSDNVEGIYLDGTQVPASLFSDPRLCD